MTDPQATRDEKIAAFKKLLEARMQAIVAVDDFIHMNCEEGHKSFNKTSLYRPWQCPDSPIGYCIYNELDDPYHYECLYCHDPEERK